VQTFFEPLIDPSLQIRGRSAWKFQDRARIGAFYTYEKNARTVRGNDAGMLSVLAVVPLNQWTFLAGYHSLNDLSDLHQDIKQLNLGVKYLLSKRTELYTLYSAQRVDNGGKAGMYLELSSDDKQSQFNIGLRHSF
jgi:predicted porin